MARTPLKDVRNNKQRQLAINFRNCVVAYRKENGWTQSELADKCSLSPKYIADIEQGQSGNPTLETICEIAKAFGIKEPTDLLKK